MRNEKLVDIAGFLIPPRETEAAYRFQTDTGENAWLPKSQCEWDEDAGIMTMPSWLADEKGFM